MTNLHNWYQSLKKTLVFLVCIFGLSFSSIAFAGNVSLFAVDAEVRDVLNSLAAQENVSIVADQSVSGKISIKLIDVPFDNALDLIAKARGLTYHVNDNVIIVGGGDGMGRNFGQVHIFQLKYANPIEILPSIALVIGDKDVKTPKIPKVSKAPDLSSNNLDDNNSDTETINNQRLQIDSATNSVVFFGTDTEAYRIRDLLAQLDVPYSQVLLECEIVAMDDNASKDLGMEWSWSQLPIMPERDGTTVTRPSMPSGTMGGVIGFGRSPEGFPYEFYYQAKLNAMVTEGKATVLSKPKIMTLNGKEAMLNIGGEVPIINTVVNNGISQTTTDYKPVGVILRYTPRINADGFITVRIYTEVSSAAYVPEVKTYQFNKRSAGSELRLKDGETIAIGGLIGKDEIRSMSKVPLLGDIPILGALFRNYKNSDKKTEVVIFLTARIVK